MLNKIKKILIPTSETSLSQRVAKSSLWLFLSRYSIQILNIVKIVFLARLLSPSDFGIFSAATIAISLLESFSQTGFTQALIQKKGEVRDYFDTAWIVKVIRGLLLTLLLIIFSDSIAGFFGEPSLSLIIKIVGLTIFLDGLSSVAFVYAFRELQFHKYFIFNVLGTVVDLIFSVSFAFLLQNYWALVIGFLAGTIVKFTASYIIYPYLPRFSFSMKKAKELMGFGKWIFGSNILGFFIAQGESIFIGRFLGIVSLGYYQMAYKISSFLNMEIIAGALFPTYSKVQDNHEVIKNAYIKTIKILALLFMPAAGGIFVLSPDFIKVFLGAKWLPATSSLQILIWASFIWSLAVITSPVFQALGKPKIETFMNMVRLAILLLLVYPLINVFGITGAALAVLAGVLASTLGSLFFAAKIVHLTLKNFFEALFIPLVSTLSMILIIFYVKSFITMNILLFLAMVMLGILLYFSVVLLGERIFKIKSLYLLKEVLSLLVK